MAPPFHRLSLDEFAAVLDAVSLTRRINAVHLHHTWRPNRAQFRGHESIVNIWRYHTEVNRWTDISQHITVDPDGVIWTGRNWNQPPASAAGHNGNRGAGPFMIALIGDFDHGRDPFEGEQRRVALQVVALVQRKFGLAAEALRFHHQMSSKSCPGTALDYRQLVDELRGLAPVESRGETGRSPAPASRPFDDEALASRAAIEAVSRDLTAQDDPPDAEPPEDAMTDGQLRALYGRGDGQRTAGARLGEWGGTRDERANDLPSPESLAALRPHVVNLAMGQFSPDGQFKTAPEDVDDIFDTHLPRELEGARARGKPLRLLFYAHGGLVKESAGLSLAAKHVAWWKRNNVYPIYFVWETGFFETIGQLLRRSRQAARSATRDIFDHTSDRALEELVRALFGPRVWSGMKRSAELAAAEGGGAHYVAKRLKDFLARHGAGEQGKQIELHAVGHSAGSIFHAHFIPAALALGVSPFRTAHFLAPAMRVDLFHERLAALLGERKGIDHLTIFTMDNTRERDDDCAGIYRKSLLYLIYHALEREPQTPILGLEFNLRSDRKLRALLGLEGAPSKSGAVVLSTTPLDTGRSASRSVHHGDFDDDPPTMNSVARRILGVDDSDSIRDYSPDPAGGRTLSSWDDQVDWPQDLAPVSPLDGQALPFSPTPVPAALPIPTTPSVSAPAPVASPVGTGAHAATGGRRRALCVGINAYPTAPLYGCVADAQEWQATLGALGFGDIGVLLDGDATRDAILQSLQRLVTTSVAGDVVVFQFAGHGTHLPDIGGDEAGGDTPGDDEAICPIDYARGALVVDDDIREIFERIPPDVSVTCFIDCCHSGTISRFGVGAPAPAGRSGQGPRPRFIPADAQLVEAHRQFRQGRAARSVAGPGGLGTMQEVLFAACLSSEVAYEEAGHGEFTVRATRLLRAQAAGLTNEQFEQGVVAAFGAVARQHPRLYCRPDARPLGLLQPLGRRSVLDGAGTGGRGVDGAVYDGQAPTTAQLLRLVATLVEGRR